MLIGVMHNPIIAALDVPNLDRAVGLAQKLRGAVSTVKIGSELFTSAGPEVVRQLRGSGLGVFLDLKFHDIPNTVKSAVAAATRLNVQMLTVHCSGGTEMLKAAERSAQETALTLGIEPPLVLGVTVLTSMDQQALAGIGVSSSVDAHVERLAKLAIDAGLRGLVCSPLELAALRRILPSTVKLVTPGIRGAGDQSGDQKRTMSARDAIAAGADWLVTATATSSTPSWSTTSSWAASCRSASRAPTSPAPPRCAPATPRRVPGVQVNRFCASGLEATNMAAAKVMSGQSQAAIGGGVEIMSRVPMGSDGGAWPTDPAVAIQMYFVPQGISADLIATKYGISRDDVDAYAVESQKRAKAAWDDGYFKKSIVPVKDQNGVELLDHDELMRPTTTMQTLAALEPSFKMQGEMMPGFDAVALQRYPEVEKVNHVHHAGNSSGIVDGAAAILIGTKEFGEKAGLKPRARIRSFASIGSEPAIMLTGPAPASEKALKRAGMSVKDIDLWELNEAFAAVVLRYMQILKMPHDKINVNGGAIAMGHPLGATGAMILGTLLDELERRNLSTGLATLCVGAGMGTATIIERV